jgi:hypothetical protein
MFLGKNDGRQVVSLALSQKIRYSLPRAQTLTKGQLLSETSQRFLPEEAKISMTSFVNKERSNCSLSVDKLVHKRKKEDDS